NSYYARNEQQHIVTNNYFSSTSQYYGQHHVPIVEVRFLSPSPISPLPKKAPWLRRAILVNGRSANPPVFPDTKVGYVTLCSSTIRVSGIPETCTEQELVMRFKNHGVVHSVTVSILLTAS